MRKVKGKTNTYSPGVDIEDEGVITDESNEAR
jgi:hypothetical protein